MAGHFFISYSSADGQKFAFKLYDRLTAKPYSFPVWLDKHGIVPGYDFDDQIVEAIGSCQALIFLMTVDSVAPLSICKDEWGYAFKYKKPIVPLMFDRAATPPFLFGDRHYLDFTGDFDEAFEKLVAHLNWIPSPAGLLRHTQYLLQDKMREYRRATDPERQSAIEDDIAALQKECDRLSAIVNDPAESARRVNESIARGIERERQPERPVSAAKKSKFINTPPREAPTYFQDRHIETGIVADFLRDNTKRLLTVVGRGGIGKTVIVCRLLSELEKGQLPDDGGPFDVDGIVYLSSVGSRRITALNVFTDLCKLLPEDEAAELENLYKNPQASTESKIEALLARFPKGRTVLLLDNFEDVIKPETREVADVELFECLQALLKLGQHGIKVVITTRVAAVDLAYVNPERQMRLNLDDGLESPHAENILREMDSDGKAGLKSAPDSLLAEARERTLGFPRALEHLFAILTNDRDTSLREILDDTRRLLPEKVMEVLAGEAFNRLDLTAQQVMQALSVYVCPVSSVAVDYLLQPYVLGVDSAPVLKRLVNMQLVRKQEGRYYLHPVDREYALSRIPEGSPADRYERTSPPFTLYALRNRGGDYFRQVRTPSEGWKTIDDLKPQLSEFDLRYAGEDYETAVGILLDIDYDYLYVWGYFRLMADMHARLSGKIANPGLMEGSLGNRATALRVMGQSVEALACYQEALDLAVRRGSLVDQAVWQGNMGNCYQDMGHTVRAIECNERALELKKRAGSKHGLAHNLGNLGNCYADLRDNARSIDYHQKALDAARAGRDEHSEGLILSNLSDVMNDEEKFDEALRYSKMGLDIGERLSSPMTCAHNLKNMAQAYLFSGDLESAWDTAEKLRKYDVPEINHSCVNVLGVIALRQGKISAANEAFDEAIVQADMILKTSPRYFQAWHAKGLAICGLALCDETNDPAAAVEAFRTAREITRDAGIVSRDLRIFDALAASDTGGKLTGLRGAVK
jgi:tetratricopeptide (TPR) repeat protein